MEIRLVKDGIGQRKYTDIVVMHRITLVEARVQELIQSYDSKDDRDIVDLLNKINDQGIIAVDSILFKFQVNGEILNLGEMSTAEKVFLIAYIATKKEKSVWFLDSVMNLEEDIFELFIVNFGQSQYVHILTRVELYKKSLERRVRLKC